MDAENIPSAFAHALLQNSCRAGFQAAEHTQVPTKMDMQKSPVQWGTQGISSIGRWINEAWPFTADGLAYDLVEHNRRSRAFAHHWWKSQICLQLSLCDTFQHPALPEQLGSDNRLQIVQDLKTSSKSQVSVVCAPAIYACLFKFFAAICPSKSHLMLLKISCWAAPGQQLHTDFSAPKPPRSPGLAPAPRSQVNSWIRARAAPNKKKDKQYGACIKTMPNRASVICHRKRANTVQTGTKGTAETRQPAFTRDHDLAIETLIFKESKKKQTLPTHILFLWFFSS